MIKNISDIKNCPKNFFFDFPEQSSKIRPGCGKIYTTLFIHRICLSFKYLFERIMFSLYFLNCTLLQISVCGVSWCNLQMYAMWVGFQIVTKGKSGSAKNKIFPVSQFFHYMFYFLFQYFQLLHTCVVFFSLAHNGWCMPSKG